MKQVYPSKYTDRKVTAAQYLTDEICDRIAKKEKRHLPYKYWNDPYWNKIFRRQIAAANALLKEVDCLSIMEFLRSFKGKNIYSLGLKTPILNGVKNNINTKFNMENIQSDEVIIDEFIEEIPEEEILQDKPKASLWEKLG